MNRECVTSRRSVGRTLAAAVLLTLSVLVWRWASIPESATPIDGTLIININQASPHELSLLPQVGPVLARRIVENRDRLGPFRSVDDMDRVHGIGPSTLKQIREYCTAEQPQAGSSSAATPIRQ